MCRRWGDPASPETEEQLPNCSYASPAHLSVAISLLRCDDPPSASLLMTANEHANDSTPPVETTDDGFCCSMLVRTEKLMDVSVGRVS